MRNQALERTLRLLRLLQRSARSMDSLASELGVCARTIRRDLETLSVAGFPVGHERRPYDDQHVWFVYPRDGSCPVCQRSHAA